MIVLSLDLEDAASICDSARNSLVGSIDEQGQAVFAKVTQHVPVTTLRRCVTRYGEERKVKSFSCLDRYLCMAFARLTYREILRVCDSEITGSV